MKYTLALMFVGFLLVGASSVHAQKIEPIHYYSLEQSKSMTELVAQAEEEGKTPVLYFTATWCGPCKHLNKSFSKGIMKKTFADVMLIKVDVDTDAEGFTGRYGIRSVPTFVQVDAQLNETNKMVGFGDSDDPNAMARNIQRFLKGSNKK